MRHIARQMVFAKTSDTWRLLKKWSQLACRIEGCLQADSLPSGAPVDIVATFQKLVRHICKPADGHLCFTQLVSVGPHGLNLLMADYNGWL